jgi:UDP-N-acetylmuramyl pentapeptide phosphotransferase/UDP-N-acetylglucosamine-1-phosphate transferase
LRTIRQKRDGRQWMTIEPMSGGAAAAWAIRGAAIAAISACLCLGLILVLRPYFERYALAKPNARSSHRVPTPQGGGIAVILATIAATGFGLFSFGAVLAAPLVTVFAAVIVMACLGAVDDMRPIGVAPRLVLQALAVAAVIYALPGELRVVPLLPWWVERVLLFIGGLWFVNLVNFMDGIDWMTAAEVVPITGALVALGCLGALPRENIAVALALGGAMLAFAYFNRPAAKLFLGDVGSLPIGLLLGWLLIVLAGNGHLAAAVLLPLYYLADATLTLIRRLSNGEQVWEAHRTHYYQRATDRGFSVTEIVARVFALNIALAGFAIAAVVIPGATVAIAALVGGAALVVWVLAGFVRGKK